MRLYLYNVGLACTGRAQTMELQSFLIGMAHPLELLAAMVARL